MYPNLLNSIPQQNLSQITSAFLDTLPQIYQVV